MTNQRAICLLSQMYLPCFDEEEKEALSLAINTLSVKAQEPRVLTLEEIKEGEPYWLIAGKNLIPQPVICVHREDDAQKPYIVFTWQYGTFSWESEDYGKRWRCWSSRPSTAEMEAIPWN